MPTAYLGLGSNEGDRLVHLRAAVKRLQAHDSLRVTAASPVYETEAHTVSPDEEQPSFLNAVLEMSAECSPEALLHAAHQVERAEGRVRKAGRQEWRPRPLDIDLLAVDDITCQTDDLTLPHPRLAERRFVLQPWADLAPNFVVPPPFDQSVQSLLDECADETKIRRTDHALSDEIDALASSEGVGA
jgi:2-amino-4-hydroxy-6-hydroxymethyldihydropteridine diphosphokinase